MLFSKIQKQQIKGSMGQFVYGATDGTVTTFAVVAGSSGGGLSPQVALTLGFANLMADGISMGISTYLSEETTEQIRRTKKSKKLLDAIVTFLSFLLVGSIPLLSYVYYFAYDGSDAVLFQSSSVLAMSSFILIGILRAKVTGTGLLKNVIETSMLGAIAATAAFTVGKVIERIVS
jgi:vacuolar iron transporter family protein